MKTKFSMRRLFEKITKLKAINVSRKALSDFWQVNKKQVYIAISVVVVCLILAWILCSIFLFPRMPAIKETRMPAVPMESITQTELTETINLFGPWDAPRDSKTLALLQENGGIRISRWTISFPNKEWRTIRPPEITNMTLEQGRVKIMTNKRRIFNLAVFQPFILEQMPRMVYLIDDGGKIWGISTDQAVKIRKEESK